MNNKTEEVEQIESYFNDNYGNENSVNPEEPPK
jgi:hypothetical protein